VAFACRLGISQLLGFIAVGRFLRFTSFLFNLARIGETLCPLVVFTRCGFVALSLIEMGSLARIALRARLLLGGSALMARSRLLLGAVIRHGVAFQ
jgi:hypothetical protein